jgi:hypothetical protein
MSPKPHIPFHFHANGHALSGQFVRPVPHSLGTFAATSLPSIGGHAHAHVESHDVPRLVSFKNAHTHVSGSWEDEDTITTEANASIEHLKILHVLTADRIVSRLTAEAKRDQKEPHILAIGSTFGNLRVGGYEIKVSLRHDLFLESKTFAEFQKRVTKDAKAAKMSVVGDGVLLCSLVDEIVTDLPGAQIKGHILIVPHFGKIAFAEVFAADSTRTLTMLRLELGSPDSGSVTVTETLTNGKPMPPH